MLITSTYTEGQVRNQIDDNWKAFHFGITRDIVKKETGTECSMLQMLDPFV